MAIMVIVELQAKPGRRDELVRLLERIVASHGPNLPGFLGSTRYEVLDDPDTLIEIAEWESAEARVAHMEESAATGSDPVEGLIWSLALGAALREIMRLPQALLAAGIAVD